MCEIYKLDQIVDLREVEEYCSNFYQKLGLSHNLSAMISDSQHNIFQCADTIFSKIKSQNIYFNIVKEYVSVQHRRYGCGVKTFIVMLGCLLHYIINLLEEKLSNRYLIQGLQEGLDILIHLYRKAGKRIEDQNTFQMDQIFGREPTDFLKNQLTKIMNISKPNTDDEQTNQNYLQYVKSNVNRLCHYESVEMKNILWSIVKGILFNENVGEIKLSKSSDPITSLTLLINHTLNGPSGSAESSTLFSKFMDDIQNLIIMTLTNTLPNEIENLSIHSGLLVNIKTDVAEILSKFAGLKNCLLFFCDINCYIMENQYNAGVIIYSDDLMANSFENKWETILLHKIISVQANCILLSGRCDISIRDELLLNLDIAVIENVNPKILNAISSIMDVNMIHDINSNFTTCQLMLDIISSTKFENSILASIQIPQWMKIFGVTANNFKTIIIRHPSREIAEALLESFNHNLKRIENSLSMGYNLEGSGALEMKFAAELKARAENKIITNNGIESIDVKSKVLLAITKSLEMFHFHLKSNLANLSNDANQPTKLDDLESKIGCIELLSECLTQILSTNSIISNTDLEIYISKQ